MRHALLLIMLLLLAVNCRAQRDTLSRGYSWHDDPPPLNLVNAGYGLEDAAMTQRDAVWVALASIAAGVWVGRENKDLGTGVMALGCGYGIVLHMRGLRRQRHAAHLLQLGYDPDTRYELAPDDEEQVAPTPLDR